MRRVIASRWRCRSSEPMRTINGPQIASLEEEKITKMIDDRPAARAEERAPKECFCLFEPAAGEDGGTST